MTDHPTYFHSGGDLMQRINTAEGSISSAMSMAYARGLVTFYAERAMEAEHDDLPHARRCARTCEDLIKAIADFERWQEAARPCAQIIPFRKLETA